MIFEYHINKIRLQITKCDTDYSILEDKTKAPHLPTAPASRWTRVRGRDRVGWRRRHLDTGLCGEVWARSLSKKTGSSPRSMNTG